MCCCKSGLFIGGILVGAVAALMLTPESGEELRKKIRRKIQKFGNQICRSEEEVEDLVEEIAKEIELK